MRFSISDGNVTAYADKSDDEPTRKPYSGLKPVETQAGIVLLDLGDDPTKDDIEFKSLGFKPSEWSKVLDFVENRTPVTITDAQGRQYENCILQITDITSPRRFTRYTATIKVFRPVEIVTIGGFI